MWKSILNLIVITEVAFFFCLVCHRWSPQFLSPSNVLCPFISPSLVYPPVLPNLVGFAPLGLVQDQMVLEGLKVLTGTVSDLCLSGCALPRLLRKTSGPVVHVCLCGAHADLWDPSLPVCCTGHKLPAPASQGTWRNPDTTCVHVCVCVCSCHVHTEKKIDSREKQTNGILRTLSSRIVCLYFMGTKWRQIQKSLGDDTPLTRSHTDAHPEPPKMSKPLKWAI